LEAGDKFYRLLDTLPWYQKPTEERLHLDEFRSGVTKVKPDVLCTTKRGMLSSQSPKDSPPKKRGAEEALLIAEEVRGAEEALQIAEEVTVASVECNNGILFIYFFCKIVSTSSLISLRNLKHSMFLKR
jgi:hypothetical protein